jgi:hypothetical protein
MQKNFYITRTFCVALIVYALAFLSLAFGGLWSFPFFYSGPPIHPNTTFTDLLAVIFFCVVSGSFILLRFGRFGRTPRLRAVAIWCFFGGIIIGPLLVAAVFVVEALKSSGVHEALFYRGQATGCLLFGMFIVGIAVNVFRRPT